MMPHLKPTFFLTVLIYSRTQGSHGPLLLSELILVHIYLYFPLLLTPSTGKIQLAFETSLYQPNDKPWTFTVVSFICDVLITTWVIFIRQLSVSWDLLFGEYCTMQYKMLKEACLDLPFSDINSVYQDLHFLLGQISGVLMY